jgi:phage-related protein
MGFLDTLKSGWNSFTKTAAKVGAKAWDGVKSVANKATGAVSTVYNDVKSGVSGYTNNVFSLANHVVGSAQNVLNNGISTVGSTVSSVGSSLAMPLAIGAGILGFVMLTRK